MILQQSPQTTREHAWHALAPADVEAALRASAHGLTAAEVKVRRARVGANVVPLGMRKTIWSIAISQFASPFVYLLAIAAAVASALGHGDDTVFIAIVLVINAGIGGYQEWRSETRVQALQDLVTHWITVIRDSAPTRVDGRELVPGDMVLVESGLLLPADIRLFAGTGLRVDESLLTGESMAVDKEPADTLPPSTLLADRGNMLHGGTIVAAGRGKGMVVATGASSQVGKVAAATADGATPPLVLQMNRFTKQVAAVLLVVIALLVVVEIARGAPIVELFVLAVALAVSAIPEGLPIAMTVALSIAVSRMAQRNVVVRALPAAEGLGSCTMIATDKTGTLTVNKVTAVELWTPKDGSLVLSDPGPPMSEPAVVLARAAALSGEAEFNGEVALGDPIDIACIDLARRAGQDPNTLAKAWPLVARVSYEPHLRFGAAFHRRESIDVAFVKGALEAVAPMCGPDESERLHAAATDMAKRGLRVLAVAEGPAAGATAADLAQLRCAGLLGFKDPLRPEVPDAVARCKAAGVAVSMITGDHPQTALAIGREMGLATSDADVVTGAELARTDEADLAPLVARGKIFARIDPLQKLAIVAAMQARGHVVAVTGDGVNDAPALKQADLGVAMGRGGTDAARQAADLVITDDNFASIVSGIEEGRAAYDNVRKVILMLITTGCAELVLFLLSTVFGLPLPFTAVQLLWLNLVTQGVQGVALAFEQPEPDLLRLSPRKKDAAIIDNRMITQVALGGGWMGVLGFAFYAWALGQGTEPTAAQNALLWLFVSFENAHVLNCRSERRSIFAIPLAANPFVVISVVIAQALHIAASYAPGLASVLDLSPLPLWQWAALLGLASSLIGVMEIYKAASRTNS